MSHQIHTTKALVLGSLNISDADKYFYLLTEDFGYIGALAKGIRLEKSKLRYALQEGSATTISLVKGRQIWRVTHALPARNIFSHTGEVQIAFFRIAALLRRLLHTDEVQKHIFALVHNYYQDLIENSYSREDVLAYELLLTGKILRDLGYWNSDIEIPEKITHDQSILSTIYSKRTLFVEHIKKSLEASQL